MISELTGLEVSNASVYDGSNAVAEAALMTARLTKRDPRVAVSEGLNPRYREVIQDGWSRSWSYRSRKGPQTTPTSPTTSPASSSRARILWNSGGH